MGKAVAGAGLATAAVICGGYSSMETFVAPQHQGTSMGNALRGSHIEGGAAWSADSRPSLLKPAAAVTGALVLAACRSARPARVCRRAAATAEPAVAADAGKVEEPPPAPFNPADQYGATAPLGYFDPLGFCKVGDEKTFRQMRVAEMKHGRVAMLASVGLVVQHYSPAVSKMAPKGIGAVMNNPGGLLAVFLLSGVVEAVYWNLDWKEEPQNTVDKIGDYGNPWQVYPKNMDSMKNRELNNGRAAMIATLAIIVTELATGKDGPQQLGWS